MLIEKISFRKFKDEVKEKEEGLVLYGCGGDHQEWVTGISQMLKEEGITQTDSPEELWKSVKLLTTTGGRMDLAFVFKDMDKFAMGKLAMWKLRLGSCSWISDYIVNYAKQHR